MDDAKLECFIPRGVEGVAVRRFGSAIGAVDWAAYYLFNEDNGTILPWSRKVRDFPVPPRQPSRGAIAPRDGCRGGTVTILEGGEGV